MIGVIKVGRTREFVTDRERLLMRSSTELNKLTPIQRAVFFRDLRRKGFALIDALAFFIQHLPEKQQARLFTSNMLQPLIHNLVGKDLKDKERTNRHYQLAQLLAIYGLNVCQDRITKRNPDAAPLIFRTFNESRELIRLVALIT